MRRIFNFFSWIVMAIVIGYIAVASPMLFGNRPVVVLSGSMEPSYPVGSLTYYHAAAFEEIKAGDVITFKAGDSLVTHRVEEKNDLSRTLITKGDHNETQDINPVKEADLVGKTSTIAVPYLGYIVSYGRNMTVIILMGAILLISYLLDVLDKKQGRKHEEHSMEE
ncbi:signal peptidase I [Hespellia stercorisuis]|uniref:Signal peptidase I n=1 Tax=Hespellia stercorisuis DSM 15480 TaxID=1121950 RepID=A0A1M6I977_9FIRM|nr:signal peptidase I [Hespellia stercorisuis]SHJ31001.1 signal peptidase, endoplasmic reticulum-type [Hespellia stercorisuis DSM 15480]